MVHIPPLKIYAQASRTGLTHWQDPKVFCLCMQLPSLCYCRYIWDLKYLLHMLNFWNSDSKCQTKCLQGNVRNGLDMSGTAMCIALAELQNCCKLMTQTQHSGAPVRARLLHCSRCYTMTTQLWGSKHSSMIYYHTTTVGTIHTRSTTWSSVLWGTQKLIQNKIKY